MNTKIKKMMFKRMMFVAVLLLSIVFASASHAVPLTAFGPRDLPVPPGNGFPLWYQDSNGLTIGQCNDAVSGFCIVLADEFFNPGLPLVFPTNWPAETFYYLAETFAGPLFYRVAIETGFGGIGNPADGQQAVFSRVRFRADVTVTGTYTVTHPYGVETFNVTAIVPGPEINQTLDVFGLVPLSFNGPTDPSSAVGPFLRSTTGNVTDPVTGNVYLANPAATVLVTGSPFGTNFVEIRDPAGVVIGRADAFNLQGKIMGLAASPAAVTFKPQKAGVVTAATITITNPLTTPATLGAGAFTGANAADFAIAADTCTTAPIAAAGTCAVTVNFTEAAPGVNGTKSAILSFPVTTPLNMPPLVVNLAGSIDSIPPTVASSLPANGAINWPANNRPHVTFSEPVTGVSNATFTLVGPAGDVGGTATLDAAGTLADYALPQNLQENATYTGTVTTGVTDIAGNPMQANFTFSFTTTVADTNPPTVSGTTPLNNATGVRVGDTIRATFSGAVDQDTVNATTFILSDGATGNVTYDPVSRTAILKPNSPLEFFHAYTATIKSGAAGVLSLGQVPMAADKTWTFFTNGAPNTPVLHLPADGATGVAQPVQFQWVKSEDQDGGTVTYHLWYCTNPAMLGCTPVDVAGTSTAAASSLRKTLAGLGGYGAGMLLAGFAIVGGVKFKKKLFFFIAVLAISAMTVAACSTKTETETVNVPVPIAVDPATLITKSVSGLNSGTTYYWKVVADDGNGALINSETRSLKTL